MKHAFVSLSVAALLAACAYDGYNLQPGVPEAEVVRTMGKPAMELNNPDGSRLLNAPKSGRKIAVRFPGPVTNNKLAARGSKHLPAIERPITSGIPGVKLGRGRVRGFGDRSGEHYGRPCGPRDRTEADAGSGDLGWFGSGLPGILGRPGEVIGVCGVVVVALVDADAAKRVRRAVRSRRRGRLW